LSFDLTKELAHEKNYDVKQKWQEIWVVKFILANLEIVDGMLVLVKCTIYSTIINVPKHIVHELDNLEKHMGKC
jgi:hypothetical protein